MADKKISQLSNATTPVAGTEVLPIVQSSSTVKVSIDNLTKGRTVNASAFDTDVAAAGVTLSGTTLAADGTDANININITPKGTGEVALPKVNIDAGAIDGTAIGANSASTGAFTTLSASGNVTLSGGTANGVLYLNGSKVSTSGSALVFDGANLGVGATPSAWLNTTKAVEVGTNKANLFAFTSGDGLILGGNAYYSSAGWKYVANGVANSFDASGGYFRWNIAGSGTAGNAVTFTQALTLDTSGNLGVGAGATSPTSKLDVASGSNLVSTYRSNTARTRRYVQTITTSSSTPVTIDIDTGYSPAIFTIVVNAMSYLGGASYYVYGVGRGYLFSSPGFGMGFNAISNSGLTAALSYVSQSTVRVTITDSVSADSKAGVCEIVVTVNG